MDPLSATKTTRKQPTTLTTATGLDPTVLTPTARRLKTAAEGAAKLPVGPERAAAFSNDLLPILLPDAAKLLGTKDTDELAGILAPAVAGAGSTEPSLGLKHKDDGSIAPDPDYPPRAANSLWPDFAAALGISKGDAAAVTKLNEQIGAYPTAKDSYSPAFDQLSPELKGLVTNVSRSLLGEDVKLSSTEQAFKANLVLNNLTWHTTNFQRGAVQADRTDPLARNNVFNNYSDNLAYANARGGLAAVMDIVIPDAYNAGKPDMGKAKLEQPKPSSHYRDPHPTAAAQANRLEGALAPGAEAFVPQKSVW